MNLTKRVIGFLLIATLFIIYSCSGSTRDQEGNILKMVKIGQQVWMAENLNVSHFSNGCGFSGPPAGGRSDNGSFFGDGSHAYWWTATEVNASDA